MSVPIYLSILYHMIVHNLVHTSSSSFSARLSVNDGTPYKYDTYNRLSDKFDNRKDKHWYTFASIILFYSLLLIFSLRTKLDKSEKAK